MEHQAFNFPKGAKLPCAEICFLILIQSTNRLRVLPIHSLVLSVCCSRKLVPIEYLHKYFGVIQLEPESVLMGEG
jgi:hypothetical protein